MKPNLFTRKQAIEILGVTRHQFDYLIRQAGIEPLRFAQNQILFDEEMLIKAKLALLLKERKLSKNYIREFLENLGESILKLSELFLVNSPAKITATFPKIKSDQYLLTKEEAEHYHSEIISAMLSNGSVPRASIERMANIEEVAEEIHQKIQQIQQITEKPVAQISHDKVFR